MRKPTPNPEPISSPVAPVPKVNNTKPNEVTETNPVVTTSVETTKPLEAKVTTVPVENKTNSLQGDGKWPPDLM